MYALFSNPPRTLGGQIVVPRFKDVEIKIKLDMNKIIDYYRNGTFFVKTDHLLVRLIGSLLVPAHYDLGRYYEVANARALPVANSLRLTSSINQGQWFSGVFYHGCQEIILAYSEEENPYLMSRDWKNIEAVKVLDCPVSNMGYMLPNGAANNTEEGLAVIGIDIPKLMVQYRCFYLEQQQRQAEGNEQNIGIRDFVGKYVIPNMLRSQTDMAIQNRVFNLVSGAPMGAARKKHPFHVSDYTELLDNGLDVLVKRVTTTKMRYRDVLQNIPSVFSDYPLQMPDVAETRQCWWALFLTRLKATQFLFDVMGEQGRHYNQADMNALKIDLKRFNSENIYRSVLPADMYGDVNYQLKQMLAVL